jgi:hypothetical protein
MSKFLKKNLTMLMSVSFILMCSSFTPPKTILVSQNPVKKTISSTSTIFKSASPEKQYLDYFSVQAFVIQKNNLLKELALINSGEANQAIKDKFAKGLGFSNYDYFLHANYNEYTKVKLRILLLNRSNLSAKTSCDTYTILYGSCTVAFLATITSGWLDEVEFAQAMLIYLSCLSVAAALEMLFPC